MAREYTRDASEYGQQQIADAIKTIGLSTQVDTTLSVSGTAADAKAAGDAISAVESDVADNTTDIADLKELVSTDGTSYILFGKVITFEEGGTISWEDQETEDEAEETPAGE